MKIQLWNDFVRLIIHYFGCLTIELSTIMYGLIQLCAVQEIVIMIVVMIISSTVVDVVIVNPHLGITAGIPWNQPR